MGEGLIERLDKKKRLTFLSQPLLYLFLLRVVHLILIYPVHLKVIQGVHLIRCYQLITKVLQLFEHSSSIYSRHQLIHWFSGVMHGRWFAVCGRIADVNHGYQFILLCIWEDFSEQSRVE